MRYPNLDNADLISVDIETRDPGLSSLGPSNYRKPGGHILGVAIAAGDHAEYYDWSKEGDQQYVKDTLSNNTPKIGHNLYYDVDWLESQGCPVNGELIDTMIAEALIDNTQASYTLDTVAHNYLQETKEDQEIIAYLATLNITPTKSRPAQDYLYLVPYEIVRKYAIQDVTIPLRSWPRMKRIMETMGVMDVFRMEQELTRVLLYMRRIGTPYSIGQSKICSQEVEGILFNSIKMIDKYYDNINPNSPAEVAPWFRKLGIPVPSTDKGNPSIKREYLEHLVEIEGLDHYSVHNYLPLLILNARRLGKSERDYITGIRENFVHNDTIRCSFHQTRDANNFGTVSGRFSSSKPNLQQITSKERDSFIGGLCRRPFIPLPDHDWLKIDYSQIEYRLMAHYAKGPGSNEIRANYNDDPTTDYHSYIVDLTGLERPIAKNLNFGIAYGMGVNKMKAIYGWDDYKAYEILETYHGNAPFIKYSMSDVSRVATSRGYIKTILGRRSQLKDKRKAYVMFNYLIQGSAADLMKKAMVDIYKSGVLDYAPMHLTVHDELGFSVPQGNKQLEIIKEIKHLMETAIPLRVPVVAEASIGPNWGDVEKLVEEETA